MDQPLRNKAGLTEPEYLAGYDPSRFERPSVTVDAVILTVEEEPSADIRRLPEKVLRVLLVKRTDHPYLGRWALPGGFVRMNESLDQAVTRILERETGLKEIYLEQLYTWGEPERDPRTRVISASYLALVDATALQALAPEARWFTLRQQTVRTEKVSDSQRAVQERTDLLSFADGPLQFSALLTATRTTEGRVSRQDRQEVENAQLAFDHARIIHYALERMRGKLEWTDIAFNLVPELFTLKELQKVYEVILGREILDMQFRRNTERMVQPTNQMRAGAGHRPARLFRFNPGWAED